MGAIYPAMMNAIIALDCIGYKQDDPVYQNAVDEFMDLMVEEEDRLWFQPCFSPVWDTAIATAALKRSGMAADDPHVAQAAEWLMKQEITIRGDWQIKNPYGPTSGWAFEFDNDYYADTDDTAMVLMAIHGAKTPDAKKQQIVLKRGLEWLLSMQSSDGGWGAFDVDNNKEILNNIPFADHNALLDSSCADITGRILEMLGYMGYDKSFSPAERAIKYLAGQQEKDGSWYGRWGVNYIYGTWQAITGLAKIAEATRIEALRRALSGFWPGHSAGPAAERRRGGSGRADGSWSAGGSAANGSPRPSGRRIVSPPERRNDLLQADQDGSRIPAPVRTLHDYASTGLSLKDDPIAFLRDDLRERRVIGASNLRSEDRCPQGRRVRVAGLVLWFIGFFFEASVGMVGFRFLEITSILWIVMTLNFFISGQMLPLDFLPPFWAGLLKLLPFQYMAYFPAVIFLEKVKGWDLVMGLALEVFWVGFFLVLCRWLYKRGLKQYGAYGG